LRLEVEFACSVLRKNLVVLTTGEGRFSKSKQMENNSNTKKIANRAVLSFEIFKIDNLRGHIAWSTTSDEHIVFLSVLG
jgi:hypothetical protein